MSVVKRNVPYLSSISSTQVHLWARTSPDIHAALSTDLLLYEFAVAIFMQQTADSLGTQWG